MPSEAAALAALETSAANRSLYKESALFQRQALRSAMNRDLIREQLQQQRRELLGRITHLNKDKQKPLPADSEEQALELENLDVLFELDSESRHLLQQVNNALERLDNDEYDICARCGEKIDAKRLQALPFTELCFDCATDKDRLNRP